ncbi:hypothetical protein [Pseudoalteromonas denitrificans]|uniref:Uncharacterized protein n=1 Tax=Pseudoalteromonas denitrificans DSM 6059 TaxID=1123010 RepID=A0A1I1RK18_9GAMM|nr:hypothetical protein [Pseudoalteromonas denitrificans]SFD34641.1 hypothetical protein SAMN02745724_04265 [Pseudoalteromonas denitrificans DSM 6059]
MDKIKTRNRSTKLDPAKVRGKAEALYGIKTEREFIREFELFSSINAAGSAPKQAWSGSSICINQSEKIAVFLKCMSHLALLPESTPPFWEDFIQQYQSKSQFSQFCIADKNKRRLIEPASVENANRGFDIPINSDWWLKLSGEENDRFVIFIRSSKQFFKLAPISNSQYSSEITENMKGIDFPNTGFLSFSEKDGAGWRQIIVIKVKQYSIKKSDSFREVFESDLNLIAYNLEHFNESEDIFVNTIDINLTC